MMAARDDTRTNSLRHPGGHDVVSNLSFHPHEVSALHVELCSMAGMNPKRIRVGNLIEPFRVGAASVNLHRQTKGGNQNRLILFELVGMDVAFEITRNCMFRPAPCGEGVRIKLQPATRRREAALYLSVNFNSDKAPAFFITIRGRDRHYVYGGRFGRASQDAAKTVFTNVV